MSRCNACGAAVGLHDAVCHQCGQSLQAAALPLVSPRIFTVATAPGPAAGTGHLSLSSLLNGRYRLLELAGIGGMGAVYEAADIQFGNRVVAVKEMSQSSLSPPERAEAADAFRREALLLASLQHPNLPKVYDHFFEAGRWYLVMDFIEGETLEDGLHQVGRPRLTVADVLRIADQLCAVLDFLHQHHPPIIFRDLKPSNVMVSPTGHIYLIDFGIARLFRPGQPHDTVALGSPGFAAPEQYGKSQTTVRSDIFSLGALLHLLLTGDDPATRPFVFPPIRAANPSVPTELETLVAQMVQLDESKRPASVAAVRRQLRQIAVQLNPIPSVPPQGQPHGQRLHGQPNPPAVAGRSVFHTLPPSHRSSSKMLPLGPITGFLYGTVAVFLLCCVLATLVTLTNALLSGDPSSGLGLSDSPNSAQAISDAEGTLQDRVTSMQGDVQTLSTDANFDADLRAYATDWSRMQSDYQHEVADYDKGCGADRTGASTVAYDASQVSYDLSSISYDDSSLAYTISPLNRDMTNVTNDISDVQSALRNLQDLVNADSSASPSAANAISTAQTALTNAQQQLDTSKSALQSAQNQATKYNQMATKLNDTAQQLAQSMRC